MEGVSSHLELWLKSYTRFIEVMSIWLADEANARSCGSQILQDREIRVIYEVSRMPELFHLWSQTVSRRTFLPLRPRRNPDFITKTTFFRRTETFLHPGYPHKGAISTMARVSAAVGGFPAISRGGVKFTEMA